MSTMGAPTNNPSSWRVVAQQETTAPGPAGTYTKGVIVSFVTGAGETGSVFVPNNVYNAETVREMVAAKVAVMAGIGALSSD
jgi:hypothetical protein